MHGHTAPRLISPDPVANRIATLSHEYLTANDVRREEIGEEIAGMIGGSVVPLVRDLYGFVLVFATCSCIDLQVTILPG